MSIEPGSQLLHYRIVEKIGEGGMGHVWKASDTTLGRDVAIKVLPESVAANPDRLARFQREARLLASLKHPNITTVHGLHETNGVRFLVMEFVDGEDLSERLTRGALPVDEALVIARQVAEALEAAHEQGIVHRDLKPANVMLVGDDQVQVLDFGLAKALAPEPLSGTSDEPALSPTVTSTQTRDGVILGTAAYMSPEQARGKSVDRRADIWAFGCLLYELLTAKSAFAAETVSDTLVAVLSGTVDEDALPPSVSGSIRGLLARCLEKDARRRLRDIGEARIVLEDAIVGVVDTAAAVGDATGATAPESGPGSTPARRILLAGAAIALFAAGWFLRPGGNVIADPTRENSIRRLTFDEGLEFEPQISPDGNYVVYTTSRRGNLDIEVIPIDAGDANTLIDHPADDAQPTWSPDGTRIAFVSARDRDELLVNVGDLGPLSNFVMGEGGDIFLVPSRGGVVTKLVEDASYPTWSPDGEHIAFQSSRDGEWGIWRIPVSGGDPVRVTPTSEKFQVEFQPAWSPNGRWIAYGWGNNTQGGLHLIPAEGGEPILLHEGPAAQPAWSPDGRSLYFSSKLGELGVVLDLFRLEITADGRPASALERMTLSVDADIDASPSKDGRMAYSGVSFAADIWSVDMADRTLTQWTDSAATEDYPSVNRDGQLLYNTDSAGASRILLHDLKSGERQLVSSPGRASAPNWAPDGKRFMYVVSPPGDDGDLLCVQRLGDVSYEVVGENSGTLTTGPAWSLDGSRVAGGDPQGISVHTFGGETVRIMDGAAFPTFSPDGKRIAYQFSEGVDRRELWAVPVEGGEPELLAGGDVHYSHPRWHPTDPDKITFVIDHKDVGVLNLSTGEVERVTDLAASTTLVDYATWSPDGKQIFFSITARKGDIYLIEELDDPRR